MTGFFYFLKLIVMERLTDEQIKHINNTISDSWNQGIFREPWGIDVSEKGYVIYQRHETGGISGGSCWDSSNPQPYTSHEKRPDWEAMNLVLKEICPDISYLKYKSIEGLVKDSSKTEYKYYGNCTDFDIWFLPLETLYSFLGI